MNELETSYIHKISLKNYKSIRDLTIDFHPGLNIMIGQNGSGKTNFVQAVQSVLSESLHHKLPIGFEFGFEFTSLPNKLKKKWTGNVKEMNHKTIEDKKIKIYESKLGKIKKESLFHPDIINELPFLEPSVIPFTLTNLSREQSSDGTKKLSHIISQTIQNQSFVIIESPEMGLHPERLFQMMDFLKTQSKSKQIIVTTHSPDALNILEKDELHKIIVTRFDIEKGTLMHHLSPKKIAKAHRYMDTKGLELKDFWVHSNLEEVDEVMPVTKTSAVSKLSQMN